jgi:hypothetical protein
MVFALSIAYGLLESIKRHRKDPVALIFSITARFAGEIPLSLSFLLLPLGA